MIRCSKLAAMLLIWTIGMSPATSIACASPTMQTCHLCYGDKIDPNLAVATGEMMPPSPCCALSSGKQAPRTESQVKSGTAELLKPVAILVRLETPPQPPKASEDRYPLAIHSPAQPSLCTFLI